MRLLFIILALAVGLVLASLAALYSYGRFARQAQGEPSSVLSLAEDATPLDRFVAPLLREHPGESGLALIASNLDAFAMRALAARHAGRSLDLQYYIWKDDLTGRLLAGEIVKAADRGVRVRLLLDDINAIGRDPAYLAMARHPNIDIRLFNPSRTRTGTIRRAAEMLLRAVDMNRRMHNKAWIADGRVAIVGGRNVGDAYFDAAEESNFRDLDLLLYGEAVEQTGEIFDRFWNSGVVIPIEALGKEGSEEDLSRLRESLAGWAESEQARPYFERLTQSEWVRAMISGKGPIHWTRQATVLSDPPEKARGGGRESWLIAGVIPALRSAKQRAEITSPYFIPGVAGTEALVGLVSEGVDLEILTNSLAATDVVAVHGSYAHYRKALLEGGVKLFELRPDARQEELSLFGSSGASLHTKAFAVDGRTGFVGSLNFDPRSVSLNTEMGVLFEDEALAGEMHAVFAEETAPANSYRVLLEDGALIWLDESRAPPLRLGSEPEAGFWRRMMATIVGWLPIESFL